MKGKYFLSFIFFLIYLLLGLVTLKDYNISWDEPTHFKRGQAYLRYYLMGEKTYQNLPPYDLNRARTDSTYHERSIYQENGFDTDYYLKNDGDHPVLNDILAALSNYVFYQKLGLLGDVESYHLFEIFVSAVLIGIVFLFGYEAFGLWSGIFSAIFLATYPLFWAESHFNIKDPIETTFFTTAIYFIWKSLTVKKLTLLFVASLFVGMAFATKLNVVFMPFIILPWLSVIIILDKKLRSLILSRKFIFLFTLIPFIAYGIFVASWPWLWQDVISNTLKVLGYYKEIGTEARGWSLYALKWIFFSTPPLVLLFFSFTTFFLKKSRGRGYVLPLLYFWLSVTILRVTVPGASIYGGVRQIMEYIPPLVLIAGTGAGYLIENLKFKYQKFLFVVLPFAFLVFSLYRFHPNENVYLNSFIGGVKGAKQNGFPSAGFSFGNAYLQGLAWLNQNAERGAKLALVQGTTLNIPAYKIRADINYSNAYWSGIMRKGEYLIELTHNYELKFYPYAWEYVETMLEPVYEVKVGGATILTIWKNDLEHTKLSYRKEEILIKRFGNVIDMGEEVNLTRLRAMSIACSQTSGGVIETSLDGVKWQREKDLIGNEQIYGISPVDKDGFIFFFPARRARYIKIPCEGALSIYTI